MTIEPSHFFPWLFPWLWSFLGYDDQWHINYFPRENSYFDQ